MQLLVMRLGSQSFHCNSYLGSITARASHYPLVTQLLPCRRTIIYFSPPCAESMLVTDSQGCSSLCVQNRKKGSEPGKGTMSLDTFMTPFINILSSEGPLCRATLVQSHSHCAFCLHSVLHPSILSSFSTMQAKKYFRFCTLPDCKRQPVESSAYLCPREVDETEPHC